MVPYAEPGLRLESSPMRVIAVGPFNGTAMLVFIVAGSEGVHPPRIKLEHAVHDLSGAPVNERSITATNVTGPDQQTARGIGQLSSLGIQRGGTNGIAGQQSDEEELLEVFHCP